MNDEGETEERSSLQSALQGYINTTQLEEPNLYNCETHGYVRATKRDYFKTFPPVLFMQIKRFNMDYETGEVYKINERFSFPQQIDLAQYTMEKESANVYNLYGVNVHLGDGMSEGYYYAYIKKKGEWYKFNDCYVTRAMESEAVEGTFGGAHEYKNKKKIANAYYLVYIKETEEKALLESETEGVPDDVKSTVEEDIYMAQTRCMQVYTEETVKGYWGIGVIGRKVTDNRQSSAQDGAQDGVTHDNGMCIGTSVQCMVVEPEEMMIENGYTMGQLKMHARRMIGDSSTVHDSVLMYTVGCNGILSIADDNKKIGHEQSNAVLVINNKEGVQEDSAVVLCIKTGKATDQQ